MSSIFLYVPNLIGYARVFLLIGFYVFALTRWEVAICAYIASFAGDLFDGYFAKKLNQCSTFGMILDMVTDRIATTGLLSILSIIYPRYAIIFTCLQGLDLSSHWFHMYSTATAGGHHKDKQTLKKRNFILRIYYGSYPLFAYLCVSAELTYVALYILYFVSDDNTFFLSRLYSFFLLPGCILKQLVNIAQLTSAANELAARDRDAALIAAQKNDSNDSNKNR
mmetsp:Transcript_9514/g.13157  ORF Transcript_9514/g.13157 Transcript_9514/m.13157 type:complete len:223 (+) Transcript_9514:116-784(+)